MYASDELIPILKKLRLSGVLQNLELRIRQAVEDDLSHLEFLYRLLSDEAERREARQLQLRLSRANFEHEKTLQDFDFFFNPDVPKSKILDLANGSFITRTENVALIGPSGVGKSHVAQSIGHRACLLGHKVLFTTARKMLTALRSSLADGRYDRRLLSFTSPDLLIIDDLGLTHLRDNEPLDLYEVIQRRYERSATIITSNRDIEEWYPLFNDALLAGATLDRFLHHVHVIEMEGDSFRNPSHAKREEIERRAKATKKKTAEKRNRKEGEEKNDGAAPRS